MTDTLRQIVFITGILAMVFAALIVNNIDALQNSQNAAAFENAGLPLPGVGIKSLGLINLLMAFVMMLMLLEKVTVWQRLGPKVLGAVTAVLTFIGLLMAVFLIIKTITLFFLMIGLLFSPPFGTIAYFSTWGDFPSRDAKQILSVVMVLQVGGLLAAVLVNPTLLKNIWLVLLGGTAIGLTFLLGLLHGLPPKFVVSITDAIGAIIAGIVSAIWMIIFCFSGIKSAITAIKNVVT
jgi:hypothetical protein